MAKVRLAPKPVDIPPYERHRLNVSHVRESLYAVVEALELLENHGTEHDHLLNLLVAGCIQEIEVLRNVEAWLEAIGRKAVA
jgi:hypothetical protein